MPRAKRRAARAKIAYTRAELFRLATGVPLGIDRFGRGREAIERMALAWRTDAGLREQVYELYERRKAAGRVGSLSEPWAKTKFDIPDEGRGAESLARSRTNTAKRGKQRLAASGRYDETKQQTR